MGHQPTYTVITTTYLDQRCRAGSPSEMGPSSEPNSARKRSLTATFGWGEPLGPAHRYTEADRRNE